MLVLAVFTRVCNEGASIAFCHGVYAGMSVPSGPLYPMASSFSMQIVNGADIHAGRARTDSDKSSWSN